jgi:hypothetical protein
VPYSGHYDNLVVREPALESSRRQMGERDVRAIRSKEVRDPDPLDAFRQGLLRPLLKWGNGYRGFGFLFVALGFMTAGSR